MGKNKLEKKSAIPGLVRIKASQKMDKELKEVRARISRDDTRGIIGYLFLWDDIYGEIYKGMVCDSLDEITDAYTHFLDLKTDDLYYIPEWFRISVAKEKSKFEVSERWKLIYDFMLTNNIKLTEVLDVVIESHGIVGVGLRSFREEIDKYISVRIKSSASKEDV